MTPSSRMMPQTITTKRKTFTVDSGGASTYTSAIVLNGVRASIQPDTTPEAIYAGANRSVQAYRIYIDSGQDVRAGDIAMLTDGPSEITSATDLSGRLSVTLLTALLHEGVDV